MTSSASYSQLPFEERVEKCRTYWLEAPSDLNARVDRVADLYHFWDFCRGGRRPPPECMFDRLKPCKGHMLVELAHNFPRPLPEIHIKLLWYAAFGISLNGLTREREDQKSLVDARLLEWLLTDPMAVRLVHYTGIHLCNITLSDHLNLDNATIDFPLNIVDSKFFGINLNDATTRSINFEGSECDYLKAARIKIHGRLRLASSEHTCFRAGGPVDLASAQISGDLDCSGGNFNASVNNRDTEPWALKINLANVRGSILLADTTKDKFNATGQIYALEMTVDGNVDCTNAKITNAFGDRHAISLDRSKIDGCVFLRNGFSATGEVRLIGTKITGDLDCSGGTFLNNEKDYTHPKRVALEARNIQINNCVYLGGRLNKSDHFGTPCSSFKTDGLISFDGACIGRDLFIGKHDDNEDDIINKGNNKPTTILRTDRINIRNAGVGGAMSCMADFSKVMLCLDNTNVAGLIMISKEEFWPKELSLMRFSYNYIRFKDEHNAEDTKSWPEAMQKRGKGNCFTNWLLLDRTYSPHQYEYLAGLLEKSGSPKEANTVLYASRERARDEAKKQGDWLRRILMFFQKWTIGYGIGKGYFRALAWATVLALIGIAILFWSPRVNGDFHQLLYAGFDNILPVINFNYNKETHEYIDKLNNLELHSLNIIRLLGFILAAFIAAGFAGLTQKK